MLPRPCSARVQALGLVVGIVADWIVGDPRQGHPVAGFGRVAAAVERHVWRPSRAAGAAYVLALVGGTSGAAAWVDRRLERRPGGRLILLAGVTWAALGGRSLAQAGRDLAAADPMRGPRPGPPARPDAGGTGPNWARRAAVVPGGSGVRRREHRRCGRRTAALGRAGRSGWGGRLPGRQHPGRHGRAQEPSVPPVRLGSSRGEWCSKAAVVAE
jgi:hypothetical protein